MPFEKGKPRPATSGRKKGTPNRITASVREALETLKCNPLNDLAKILRSKKLEPTVRARINIELMRYLYPQLRSVELRTAPGSPLEVADVTQTRQLLADRIAGIAARSRTDADNTGLNGSADQGD